MAEDTVSLNALTQAELRRIVNDDRYRELIQELLPRHSDGGDDAGNSSGYQESSTSHSGDTDASDSQKIHSSRRRRRGKGRLRDDDGDSLPSSSSKEGESNTKERGADHPSSRKMVGGADHSSSSRRTKGADHSSTRKDRRVDYSSSRRCYHSSGKKVAYSSRGGADHSSGSRKRRGTDHSPSRRSSRLDAGRSHHYTESSESEPVRRKRKAEPVEHPVKRPRLAAHKRKTLQSESTSAPSSKRRRMESHSDSSESDSEDESGGFNPTLEQEDRDEFRMDVPRPVAKYVNRHFRKALTKEERTAMLKKHPKPNTKAAKPPKLDQFVVDFAGKKLDKARDAQLCRIQTSVLYVANPLTCLWSQLIDQGLTHHEDATIGVSDVIDIIQRTLVLLGNANNFISETRREWALEAIHPTLKKYGKGNFTEAEEHLFGETFKETLVKKVEADSVLSKAVNIVTRTSRGREGHYQTTTSRYGRRGRFFGSRTSRYGATSGRSYNPYNAHNQSYSGRGRQTTGHPYFKKGGVFNRLGPQNTDRSHQRSNQDHKS